MRRFHRVRSGALSPTGQAEVELGNRDVTELAGPGFYQEGAPDLAVLSDDVVAVVGESAVRGDLRKLSHHAVAFDHVPDPVFLQNDPFSPADRDPLIPVVVNGEEVDERMGALVGRVEAGHVKDFIHGHPHVSQLFDLFCHLIVNVRQFWLGVKNICRRLQESLVRPILDRA